MSLDKLQAERVPVDPKLNMIKERNTDHPLDNGSLQEDLWGKYTPHQPRGERQVNPPEGPRNAKICFGSLEKGEPNLVYIFFDFIGFILVLFIYPDSSRYSQGCRCKQITKRLGTTSWCLDDISAKETVSKLVHSVNISINCNHGS